MSAPSPRPGAAPSSALDASYRGRRVLVAGGAGFLGAAIARRLVGIGAAVQVVDSLDPACSGRREALVDVAAHIDWIEAPIEDALADLDLADLDLAIDCVGLADHHLGFKHPELDHRLNCGAGLALLRAVARLAEDSADATAPRLLAFGARNQYGRQPAVRLDEATPLQPSDVQAIHKTTLEHYHRVLGGRAGVASTFFRLTNTYGPGQRLAGDGIGFVGEMVRDAVAGRELVIWGDLDRTKDLLFIDDVVDAALLAGATPQALGVFNLGGRPTSLRRFLGALDAALGPVARRIEPFPEALRHLDVGDATLDASAFERVTGWQPQVPIEDGLARTVEAARRAVGAAPLDVTGANAPESRPS
ncbi:MAG: NAD-dependent epimerase/dehydratase family protein [Acidobacteriota bacterium]